MTKLDQMRCEEVIDHLFEYLDGEMLDYHCGLVGLSAGYVRRKAG